MRRILTTLALAGLFGSLVLSNVTLAGCPPTGCPPKHAPCQAPACFTRCFTKWDACREKVTKKLDNCFNPTCCQKGAVFAVAPCGIYAAPCQVSASGQGY